MPTTLAQLLSPQRLTEVVDVGANPAGSAPPYAQMLAAGLCRVTGFEPHEEALSALQKKKGPRERYLPHAVGDGKRHTLHICLDSSMTSLLEPDPRTLDLFEPCGQWAKVLRTLPIETRRLDDIAEIEHLDFLKIDIQGGELAAIRGGAQKLAGAVAVQAEISFVTLYKDQPGFGEIDLEMRSQGFLPHCFAELKKWPVAPCVVEGDPQRPLNQLLEADLVYVRDFSHPEKMSDEQLKHLALIVHHCYGSYDVALRCVMLLEDRGTLQAGAKARYVDVLAGK
jgi:FkbM family methyltransferase